MANPTHSHAAIFHAPRQPMTIEEVPLPKLQGSEALVRVSCATICGSDLHSFTGRRHAASPSVLGHEMVGHIVDMGPAGATDFRGRPLSLGQRVTWSMVWSCGQCRYCLAGLRPKCERLMKFGHEKTTPGRVLLGGMAEHCHLPEGTSIFVVPENLPDLVASPVNCATATVASVMRHAGPVAGQMVVVLGAGMLGLTACSFAAVAGAEQVIVIEPSEERRQLSLKFAATKSLDSAMPHEQTLAVIRAATGGHGCDVVLDLAGQSDAIERSIDYLDHGGRLVVAGAVFPARPLQVSAEQIVKRLLQIKGVYNYNPEDLETALDFLAAHHERYPFASLVGGRYALDDVNAAFEFAETQRPPRVAIISD
jgi:alcohol dehydrogenase